MHDVAALLIILVWLIFTWRLFTPVDADRAVRVGRFHLAVSGAILGWSELHKTNTLDAVRRALSLFCGSAGCLFILRSCLTMQDTWSATCPFSLSA
jgi:hypothetical protein